MTEKDKEHVSPGALLIAGASLVDPNFARSVVLLCEHVGPGSFGLVLNHPTGATLDDLVSGLSWDAPVYRGGPVEENSLHFIYRNTGVEMESVEVVPGVHWGGDFTELTAAIESGQLAPNDCRFFIGYSGWGPGQLRDEMLLDSWLTCQATEELIFTDDVNNLWRQVVKTLGPRYKVLANFPDDPKLN